MTNTSEQPLASGSRPTTSREERLQTIAKLRLGHLIEFEQHGAGNFYHVYRPGNFGDLIHSEPADEWPSELLMAKLAFAIPLAQRESCRMRNVDDETLRRLTR